MRLGGSPEHAREYAVTIDEMMFQGGAHVGDDQQSEGVADPLQARASVRMAAFRGFSDDRSWPGVAVRPVPTNLPVAQTAQLAMAAFRHVPRREL